MPRAKSKLFEIMNYFQTTDLEAAKELLAACREIVRGREPQKRGSKKPKAPAQAKASVVGSAKAPATPVIETAEGINA